MPAGHFCASAGPLHPIAEPHTNCIPGQGARAGSAAPPPPALGLVDTQTRGTSTTERLTLDPHTSRIRRMRKGIITAAELLRDAYPGRKAAMLTLTYANSDDWKPNHVKDLIRHARQYLRRKGHGFPYVWVAEMQKRGAIHYHICFWLPRGITLPKPDKRGWWLHGSTRIEWAKRPVGYMVKYATKGSEGAKLPEGSRMHGCGGLDRDRRNTRAYRMAPAWVREMFEAEDEPRRAEGGGWFSKIRGDWIPSPWQVLFLGGKVVLMQQVLQLSQV